MAIFLAFAPFLAYMLAARLFGTTIGLAVGAVSAGVLVARAAVDPNKSVKVLEVGTVILFGALTAYAAIAGGSMSVMAVRFCVDTGLFLIVVISMVIGRPFTLQYAREERPKEMWTQPAFVRSNYVITGVWAAAFAVMIGADAVLEFLRQIPSYVGITAIVAAFFGAFRFTSWYPKKIHAAHHPQDCLPASQPGFPPSRE